MSSPTSPAVRLLESAIDAGTVPGGIIAHGRDPEPIARGRLSPRGPGDSDAPAFPADAIVRIQSMTKAIQAVAALRLVERGVLALDSPVDPWLPEFAAPRVLPRPDAGLDRAVPSPTEITLRHLLTCTSGLGIATAEGPLQQAMVEAGLEAGSAPWSLAADEWLAALGALPLVGEPGRVWRYHHSFSVLGILLSRATGRSLEEHLRADLFEPLGMVDTGSFVPLSQRHRLPPAFSVEDGQLVEAEPAGGGPLVGEPSLDVSHGELVSTAADYLRFLRALRDGELLSPEHLAMMTTDQVPAEVKRPDSLYPGFWDGTGWGFGVSVVTGGEHRGRWGWSGGYGTDFFVDADGTIGLLLAQVEIGEHLMPLLEAFQELPTPPS
ncbi:serine hydrolase domain-containing protein [Brachybacterium paraconglomeratum]|uniref:serine hydrolase domain-containing protein n=1 Tax=Brachybacterium paraconglomeratum TaxID=173362 RepID=UPI00387A07EC